MLISPEAMPPKAMFDVLGHLGVEYDYVNVPKVGPLPVQLFLQSAPTISIVMHIGCDLDDCGLPKFPAHFAADRSKTGVF